MDNMDHIKTNEMQYILYVSLLDGIDGRRICHIQKSRLPQKINQVVNIVE